RPPCFPALSAYHLYPHSFPTRRSSDLYLLGSSSSKSFLKKRRSSSGSTSSFGSWKITRSSKTRLPSIFSEMSEILSISNFIFSRSEEHTSELQSRFDLVCRLLLEK